MLTYVILRDVGVISLNAVVENRHGNASARIALLPCGLYVHVPTATSAFVLEERSGNEQRT